MSRPECLPWKRSHSEVLKPQFGRQKGFTLIELVLVLCIIALMMTLSLTYYQNVMDRAKTTGLQMLASRFDSTMTLLHMKWKMAGRVDEVVNEEIVYRINASGWPVGARADFIEAGLKDCQQLWQAVFKHPGKLLDFLPRDDAGMQFWTSYPQAGVCRYQLVSDSGQGYYFDYNSLSGDVKVVLN